MLLKERIKSLNSRKEEGDLEGNSSTSVYCLIEAILSKVKKLKNTTEAWQRWLQEILTGQIPPDCTALFNHRWGSSQSWQRLWGAAHKLCCSISIMPAWIFGILIPSWWLMSWIPVSTLVFPEHSCPSFTGKQLTSPWRDGSPPEGFARCFQAP